MAHHKASESRQGAAVSSLSARRGHRPSHGRDQAGAAAPSAHVLERFLAVFT